MTRIYYRWNDSDGAEQITREPPRETTSIWGNTYTPEYTKVVVIPVEDDDDSRSA